MKKNNFAILTFAFALVSFAAHSQAMFPEVTINLTYPQYQKLKMDGGSVYVQGAGLRGIILYRANENSYIAYERACPYHPSVSSAVVQVDGSTLFLVDHSCNSTFNISDGQPTGGPAQRALLQYRVEQNGTTLKISDEIIN